VTQQNKEPRKRQRRETEKLRSNSRTTFAGRTGREKTPAVVKNETKSKNKTNWNKNETNSTTPAGPMRKFNQFNNSIQHNDCIVVLRATKAFKSPLLRSRNDRCRTTRGVETFPERDVEGAEQERARGEARLRFGDGAQEVLEEKSRAIHVREVVFSSKQQGVASVVVTPVFSRASSLHPKKPCFKTVQGACESRQERAIEEAPVPLGQTRATEGIFRTDGENKSFSTNNILSRL
jgi:hypothetical protein